MFDKNREAFTQELVKILPTLVESVHNLITYVQEQDQLKFERPALEKIVNVLSSLKFHVNPPTDASLDELSSFEELDDTYRSALSSIIDGCQYLMGVFIRELPEQKLNKLLEQKPHLSKLLEDADYEAAIENLYQGSKKLVDVIDLITEN